MTRYIKNNTDDILDKNKRKNRGHKLAMGAAHNRREDRSGWAYTKRRATYA